MESNERKINKNLMTGWVIIVVVLLVAYFGEYLKGDRSGVYMLVIALSDPWKFIDKRPIVDVTKITYESAVLFAAIALLLFPTFCESSSWVIS